VTELAARAPAPAPHIAVQHVFKSFGETSVLRDVNATFLRGEIAVVIGGSGSGKTTLLKIIGGLDKPSSGAVTIEGLDIVPLVEAELNAVRRRIGMVPIFGATRLDDRVRERGLPTA
jgi:ABC-type transporter Mla maintaining outer membrane lipid asymmetry ATPase subunit MlaF